MTHDEHTHDDHLADGSIDAGEKPEQSERSDTSDTSEKTPAFRSGFVALVGRPNVGKSTLINACMNKRLAITSPVAQTTRRRLRCILTDEDSQIIMVDTPGLHKPKDALGNQLNKTALASLADVDAVALLIDATKVVGRGDQWVARHVNEVSARKFLIISKADIATPEQVRNQIDAASKLGDFDDVLVVSSVSQFNVDAFLDMVRACLPEGPHWFAETDDTDATDEDLVAEFVREKVLLLCKQEIPHSVAVTCDSISWTSKNHASIEASILVERESQKHIVIGRAGQMIKKIGMQARKDIEHLFGCTVFLSLEVKVRPLWRRDQNEIRRLGYDASE
ncbi:GTPase Era [Atopobium deltae]|uniref:GTPase Era n=1 Tax=Atopobium deltae TaxID=1393034 RepID=A0A133XSA8_9ACTN|nr:GTPase Era [Atopobium deltae]KXB33825.1 ribosome biogenesis GTPase Era [Atopobium deltae]